MTEPDSANYQIANNSRYFRDVLGNVPTAVVAVTAMDADGRPTGMTVGSFTSVSLEPPLVAFMPGTSSSTMPKIRAAGRFCANILTADQEDVCRQLAIKGGDKFADLRWELSPHGTPRIAGAIGWIDCTITEVYDAGDHQIVLGQVDSLETNHQDSPLIFLRGEYGRFASTSLSAPAESDLYHPLRIVERALPIMQAVADELGVECLASSVVGDQLVVVGSSQSSEIGAPSFLRLGQRMPFRPPLAMPLIAWREPEVIERWKHRADGALDHQELDRMLECVRSRGWSLVLRSDEQVRFERAVADVPVRDATEAQIAELRRAASALRLENYEPDDVDADTTYKPRLITAPLFDQSDEVHVVLSLYQLPRVLTGAEVNRFGDRLVAAAKEVTTLLDDDPTHFVLTQA